MLKRLMLHASKYSAGNLLVTAAGFISFPILTRVLSVEDYGLMSLVSLMLSFIVGIAKFGMQHAVVRFYAEIADGDAAARLRFFSTLVVGVTVSALITSTLWFLFVSIAPKAIWADPKVVPLMLLTAVLVGVRVMDSAFINLLRAQQHSGTYSIYNVLRRYFGLALVLFTLFYVVPGITGFYIGTVISEIVALVALAILVLKKQPVSMSAFSTPLFKSMAVFGMPMIAFELSGIILSLGDRYVLGRIAGAESVGLYSVSYNMCEYINAILFTSIGQAVSPMYMRLWEEKGQEQTSLFINKALHFYVMLAALVVAGTAATGPSFLAAVASDKYGPAGVTIPWIILGLVIDSCLPLMAAGMYIKKRTKILMTLVVACATLNIGLNVVLIPAYGIVGSAIATLISYLALSGSAMVVGSRLLPIKFPVISTIKFSVLAFITYWVLVEIHLSNRWLTLGAQAFGGLLVFGTLVLATDKASRQALDGIVARLRGNAPA